MIKENLPYQGLCYPRGLQSENQRKQKVKQVFGPCLRTKKPMEHESDGDTNCNWRTWNDSQRLGKETEGVGNRRTNPNYSIVENTEKSPGDIR